MTQLSIPHRDDLPTAPMGLRRKHHNTDDVLVVVLGAGHATSFGRLIRLSVDHHYSYRVQRSRTLFSWRSAWLGALTALGLAGGLAAAAGATQPDRPIRFALPPARPAATLAPSALIERAGGSNSTARRSPPLSPAGFGPALPAGAISDSIAKPSVAPPKIASRRVGVGSGEFYRADPVQAAAQRAILSGIAQTWTFGGLTGVVIAGPLEIGSNRACHRIALWAENRPGSGDSMAFTSCLNDRGDWRMPADLRPEPPPGSADLLELR